MPRIQNQIQITYRKMKRILIILPIVLSLSCFSQYHKPNLEWEKSYGGSDWDNYLITQVTSDGGFILAGATRSNDGDIVTGNKGGYDIWIAKMDPYGNIEWSNTYGGSRDDYAHSIKVAQGGGYILGGYTYSFDGDIQSGNQGVQDFWVVKLDSLGSIQWEKTYGGSDVEVLMTIINSSEGGYAMCGRTNSNDGDVHGGPFENNDFWVVKIDEFGAIQWQKTYGGSGLEHAHIIQQTIDGGYAIGGFSDSDDGDVQSGNKGDADFWLVKIDNLGVIQWEKTYGGTSTDRLLYLQQTTDMGYIIGGDSESDDGDVLSGNKGFSDCWLIKVNQTGAILWEKTYGGSLIEYLKTIRITEEGHYILGCSTNSYDGDVISGINGTLDYWVIRIDQSGNIIWEHAYGGSDQDYLTTLHADSNGVTLVSGYSRSYDGDVQSGNKGGIDFWVVKISENLGIDLFCKYVNVYPNPIKDNWINIDVNMELSVELKIIDYFGRTIHIQTLSQNNNRVKLDDISGGFYILRLIDNTKIIHQQKIIIE